jgi:hypothetical protein
LAESFVAVSPINNVYNRVLSNDEGILEELHAYFTFKVPNYWFDPKYKAKLWKGEIHLYQKHTHRLYAGLTHKLVEFCNAKQVPIIFEHEPVDRNFSAHEALMFARDLGFTSDSPNPLILNGEHIKIRDYQLAHFLRALRKGRALLLCPTACHPAGTGIIMFDGSVKPVEKIVVGDLLMGPDQAPRQVQRLFSGTDQIYRLKINRSNDMLVNGGHILHLKQAPCEGARIINITVDDYLKKSNNFKHTHYLLSNNQPINFHQPYPNLQLSPYFIGVYLGDGSSRSCQVTTADPEILQAIQDEALKFDYPCQASYARGNAICYNLRLRDGKKNPIIEEFKKLQINIGGPNHITCATKFIPQSLKTAPIHDRLELLAGLIDSDGWIEHDSYYAFTSKSMSLAYDVAFISRSLGFSAIVRKIEKKCYNNGKIGMYYSVHIMGNIQDIPVRIPRKKRQNQSRKPQRNPHHHLFKIIPENVQTYYGFELDGDHLYFTDNFIVNHNSGKSLIAYLIARYALDHLNYRKGLILTDRINLVVQMRNDFADYGYDVEPNIHMVYEGANPQTDKPLVITTWQSVYKRNPEFFLQFDFVINDEVHLAQAKSLKTINENLVRANLRIGMTGTLSESKTHELVLEGLFGPKYQIVKTHELIKRGDLAKFMIKGLVLKHEPKVRQAASKSKPDFQLETDYLVSSSKRNRFIANLALSLKGNTMVFYQYIDRHGQLIYDILKKLAPDRTIYFIHGKVPVDEREKIRQELETRDGIIVVSSYGTNSTGSNFRTLHNVIFASAYRAKIKTLQTIGRGLRKVIGKKEHCTLFDIADDLREGKNYENHTLKHFAERMRIYTEEKFPMKVYKIDL